MATTVDILKAGQFGQIVDKLYVKGLQKTTGSPNGYGDLASAIRDPYRNVGCVKIGGALASSGVSNRTTAATFLLRARPARMRVHLLNANTTPITGVAASLAPSQNQNLWYEPSGGVSAFKLLSLSSSTIPAAASGGGTANAMPSEVVSTWFNPSALDRNDGGSGFIFMLRVYCDASNNGARMHLGGTVATSDFSKYEARCGFGAAAGNFTTTSGVITEDGTSCPAFYLEVEYETPVASVAIVGDSIMQGANAGPSANSAAYGAAFQALKRIAATGKSVQLYNAGWSGASTNGGTGGQMPDNIVGYLGQFQSWISAGARPTIAAFCPWSVNNSSPYLASQLNSVRQSIGVFISLCENQKILPALVTPAPRNGITEAEETVRRQVVDYVKSYCTQTGTTLIDRDGVYTDYSVPTGGYKLPEWCVDGIHPTQSGHFAESFEWDSVLNTIV